MAKDKKKNEQKESSPTPKKYIITKGSSSIVRHDLSEEYIKSYEDRGWKVEEDK